MCVYLENLMHFKMVRRRRRKTSLLGFCVWKQKQKIKCFFSLSSKNGVIDGIINYVIAI